MFQVSTSSIDLGLAKKYMFTTLTRVSRTGGRGIILLISKPDKLTDTFFFWGVYKIFVTAFAARD